MTSKLFVATLTLLLGCQSVPKLDDSIPDSSDAYSLPTSVEESSSGRYYQEVYSRVDYREIAKGDEPEPSILRAAEQPVETKEWAAVMEEKVSPEDAKDSLVFEEPKDAMMPDTTAESNPTPASASNSTSVDVSNPNATAAHTRGLALKERNFHPAALAFPIAKASIGLPNSLVAFLEDAHPVHLLMFPKLQNIRLFTEPNEYAPSRYLPAKQLALKQKNQIWGQLANGGFVKLTDLADRPVSRSKNMARWKQ